MKLIKASEMDYSQLKIDNNESSFQEPLVSHLDNPSLDQLKLKQKNEDLMKQIQDLKTQILQVILIRVKKSFAFQVLIVWNEIYQL